MFTLFHKVYDGFESSSDLWRDVSEAFKPDFNPIAASLPPEFQGKLTVTIAYEPDEDETGYIKPDSQLDALIKGDRLMEQLRKQREARTSLKLHQTATG